MRHAPALLLVALPLFVPPAALAGDWPQMLGPARSGVAPTDEKIAERWPESGPAAVWSVNVGRGWAGPAVAGQRVIFFDRDGDSDRVQCLASDSGKRQWVFEYPARYRDAFGFDPGPRATPTIDGDRVYTYGAQGMLHCLDMATGKKVWEVDTVKQFKSGKGFFGRVCAPLIDGERVIVQVGGADGAGIVAFNKASGEVAWKAVEDEAGYSSPVVATLGGKRRGVFLMRSGLVVLNPADGKVEFTRQFRSQMDASVNAATPLIDGDTVLLSASYETGALALKFAAEGDPKELWSGDESLSSHYATPVCREGFVFGFHGRADSSPGPVLRCIELATGKVRWSSEPLGSGSITLVGDKLLILTEHGELILAPASAEGFKPVSRAKILGDELRASPALSGGIFYARDKQKLIAVDLRGK